MNEKRKRKRHRRKRKAKAPAAASRTENSAPTQSIQPQDVTNVTNVTALRSRLHLLARASNG